ncbi:MAG TPA: hypothetical protein VGM37_18370 [Armatimonadota bacterium]|jgi:DNA-binding response OmpR family regulator
MANILIAAVVATRIPLGREPKHGELHPLLQSIAILRDQGHSVTHVETGADAKQALIAVTPDVVVVGSTPLRDGLHLNVISTLIELDLINKVRVIALTQIGEYGEPFLMREEYADAHVDISCSGWQLVYTVRQVLRPPRF